jgi:hypothetical protein
MIERLQLGEEKKVTSGLDPQDGALRQAELTAGKPPVVK